MEEVIAMWIGVRKGDPVYGDEFDQRAGGEDELSALMTASHARDIAKLRREMGFLPWEVPESILTKDRVKLMTAIMDNAGDFPYDLENIRQILGMKAINNAKAVPNGLLRAGLISEGRDWEGRPVLNLTEVGRGMLDYYEDDPAIFQHIVAA